MQWPKENGQKNKQWSIKHYIENQRSEKPNPTEIHGTSMCLR
jgi:hypothetical protein